MSDARRSHNTTYHARNGQAIGWETRDNAALEARREGDERHVAAVRRRGGFPKGTLTGRWVGPDGKPWRGWKWRAA